MCYGRASGGYDRTTLVGVLWEGGRTEVTSSENLAIPQSNGCRK